ncbi:MAG: hypothetical protein QOI13_2893 [Paraburkholderia sp.]|jgi:hypothetical protein|nr:hypothetical protein [Paraburkholderia sp.]
MRVAARQPGTVDKDSRHAGLSSAVMHWEANACVFASQRSRRFLLALSRLLRIKFALFLRQMSVLHERWRN